MRSTPSILQALTDAKVDFVLVGGLAVQLHGFVRSTVDVDLVLAMDDVNLGRFIEVAKQFGLTPVMPVSVESLQNAQLIEQWHREKGMLAFALRERDAGGTVIDVLVRPEISFENLSADATVVRIFNRDIRIASIDDLLTMKRSADRPKDRLDVEALQKIKRGEDPNG